MKNIMLSISICLLTYVSEAFAERIAVSVKVVVALVMPLSVCFDAPSWSVFQG